MRLLTLLSTFTFGIATVASAQTAPTIIIQPQGQSVLTGSTVSFSVTAAGSPVLTYQWFKNGTPISGGPTTLTLPTVQLSDQGAYTVVVANASGVATSNPANLTVAATPVIGNSATANGYVGVAFQFTVTATNAPTRFGAVGLPAGLAIDSVSGIIAGVPTAPGATTVFVTASNAVGNGLPFSLTLAIAPAPLVFNNLAGGSSGSADGVGGAAQFNLPNGLAVDARGNLYLADTGNDTVRKITPAGVVTTLAGAAGQPGSSDGSGGAARFSGPEGIAVDSSGNVYVTDTGNDTVREITPAGMTSTLAGTAGQAGSSNGTRGGALFQGPTGIAVDAANNLYVADNQTVRKITASGIVTTLAGLASQSGYIDAFGIGARFDDPTGVAVDDAGDIYVNDLKNFAIREISAAGSVSTLSALANTENLVNGPVFEAIFNGVAVNALGNVDATVGPLLSFPNPGIQEATSSFLEITPGGPVNTLQQWQMNFNSSLLQAPVFTSVTGAAVDSSGSVYVVVKGMVLKSTLATGPLIASGPQNQAASLGQPAVFSVSATGNPNPTYQWEKNGMAIAGATSATLTLNDVQSTDSGNYSVVVSTSYGIATSNAATLTVNVPPMISIQPQSQTAILGSAVTLTVAANGATAFQWLFNGTPIGGATSASYTIGSATAANAGSYTVTVTNAGGSVTSNGGVLAVSAVGAPAISSQPQSQTMAAGSTVALTVTSGGTVTTTADLGTENRPEAAAAASYQWYLNGIAISGATRATLLVSNVGSANAGSYACLVSNSSGSALSNTAVVTVTMTTNPGRLINLSALSQAGKGQILTVGFVTGGSGTSGSQNLLIRATGPALAAFGVPNFLTDPTLSVLSGQTTVASNDNWGTPASNQAAVTAADNTTGAFALTGPASLDAALVPAPALVSGGYTVQVSANTAAVGATLAEVYDNTPTGSYTLTTPRLINLSANNQIAANSSITAGFVVGGSTSKTVLIRATGPALALLAVSGAIPDPQLALHATINGQDTVLASNAGWGGDPQITAVDTAVGAFPLTDATSKDSVVLITLAPGAYTAVASSASGTAGVVLIEIYEVP